MSVPYFGDYQNQIILYKNYIGVANLTADFNEFLFQWTKFPFNQWLYNEDPPTYLYDAADTKIDKILYNPLTNNTTIDYSIINKYEYYLPKYKITMREPQTFFVDIYLNSVLYDSLIFRNLNYLEPISQELIFNLNPFEQNFNLTFVITDQNTILHQYKYSEIENYQIYSQKNQTYIIDFSKDNKQTIKIPIAYDNNEIQYETFVFEKLFNNQLLVPQDISQLFEVKYNNPLDFNNYVVTSSPIVKIDLLGYSNNYEINTSWEKVGKNDYKLIIDDHFYYNEISKTVSSGYNQYFYNSDSLILPWDYSNNYGMITINFSVETYTNNNFILYLPIGNKYKLRGNKYLSEYYFSENYEDNSFDWNFDWDYEYDWIF